MATFRIIVLSILLIGAPLVPVAGREDYLSPEEFLQQAFSGRNAVMNKIWIKGELKENISKILGHDLNLLRIRYWELEGHTAWIMEEVGKDQPITMGFVLYENKIEYMAVLAFRESRGWEIRYPFFTDQFLGAGFLREGMELDRNIDGITGATLSVIPPTTLARLSLLLHNFVQASGVSQVGHR